MKTEPTLSTHLSGLFRAETTHYQAILAEIQADLAAYPPHLKADAQSFFDFLAPEEFSQVVALLPYWLADLLSTPPETCHKLGVAHLYGWWYYAAQDELLDGDVSPTVILAAHLALLKMAAGYQALGVTDAPYWAEFERLALASAESYTLEMQSRFSNLAELTPERLESWTVDFIIKRASPFYFNTMAQLHLASLSADSALHHALPTAISYFSAARQISDDAGDWLDDLKNGHLNYVSAQLVRRLYQQGRASGGQGLDVERLAGYQLTDESCWAEIEQTAQSLARRALDLLAPYGPCRLQALLEYQMARHAKSWATARQNRANLRMLFGLKV